MAEEQVRKEIVDVIRSEVDKAVGEIVQEKMAKALEASAARAPVVAPEQKQETPSRKAAKFIRSLAAGRGDVGKACDFARKLGDEQVVKALGETTGSGGGYLVQAQIGEWVSSLAADAVLRRLGIRILPNPTGQIDVPAGNAGATANWVGENAVAASSTPTARMVSFSAKDLVVLVPVANRLLADTSGLADQWIEEEAKKAAANKEDATYLRAAAAANTPTGMYYLVSSSGAVSGANHRFNIYHAGSAATSTEIIADLGRAINRLASDNIPMNRPAWIFSKRTEWHLKTLLNSFGVPMFLDQMTRGSLLGFPWASTTQIPNNLSVTGSADESEVYFADLFSNVIAETQGAEISVHPDAAYYDSDSGAVVSGLSQNQTVVKLVMRVDYKSLYQGQDIAVLTSVDWGV